MMIECWPVSMKRLIQRWSRCWSRVNQLWTMDALNTHDPVKINMELLFNIKTTSLSLPLVTDITNSCSILTSQVHDPFPLIVSLQMPRPLQAGTPGQAMTRYNYNIIMKDSVEREQYKCFMKNEPCWEKIGHACLFMCIKHFPMFFSEHNVCKKISFWQHLYN